MTRIPYDQAAKLLLRGVLDDAGRLELQHEVPSAPRWIDAWFEPDPQGRATPGLLGEMTAQAAAFELFHTTPTLADALRCLGKLLDVHRAHTKRSASARVPPMWIVTTGRPATVLTQLALAPAPDWPPGFYRMTAPALPLHVVVLSQLPRVRATLLLRLMGARRVLREALEELVLLPGGARERSAAIESINVLKSYAKEAASWPDSDDKIIIMSASQLYEQIKDEGRKEGRKEGREALLVRLLTRRFGKLPEDVVFRIHAASNDELDGWGERLLTAQTLDQVFARDAER